MVSITALLGQGIVKVTRQCEQLRGTHVMRGEARRLIGGLNGSEFDLTGSGFGGAIDEEHGLCGRDILCQFGGPLLPGQDAHGRFGAELLFGPFSEPWSKAIIAAQRVAAGENEAADGVRTMGFSVDDPGPIEESQV